MSISLFFVFMIYSEATKAGINNIIIRNKYRSHSGFTSSLHFVRIAMFESRHTYIIREQFE